MCTTVAGRDYYYIILMGKLKFRDVKSLTQGHTGGLLLTQTSNSDCLTPGVTVLTMTFSSVVRAVFQFAF